MMASGCGVSIVAKGRVEMSWFANPTVLCWGSFGEDDSRMSILHVSLRHRETAALARCICMHVGHNSQLHICL